MDNFEWSGGYNQPFGLVHVDFETLERTPKASYYWFQELLEERKLAAAAGAAVAAASRAGRSSRRPLPAPTGRRGRAECPTAARQPLAALAPDAGGSVLDAAQAP